MNGKEILDYIDNQRWLLNNGLFNDASKNQLFLFGSIVHKDVQAVDLAIDPANKRIGYTIYVTNSLLKKIEKYKELSTSKSFFGMWRFKRLIEKEGNLNFRHVLSNFVKDYCGKDWAADVEVRNIAEYVADGDRSENDRQGVNTPDKQPDQ
jgi:hypothetical protein